jgi:hypothetical protein
MVLSTDHIYLIAWIAIVASITLGVTLLRVKSKENRK